MAQIIEFQAPGSLSLYIKLFAEGTNTQSGPTTSGVERSLAKGLYDASFTGIAEGWYTAHGFINVSSGLVGISTYYVGTTGTFRDNTARTGADSDTLETLSDQLDTILSSINLPISIVIPTTVAEASTSTDTISIVRGDTMARTIENMGDISSRSKLWFTAKRSTRATDAEALVQITEGGGLTVLNGASATAGLGSISVSGASVGTFTISLDETATAQLPIIDNGIFDIQVLTSGVVTTPIMGTFIVTGDVTRATS